MLPYVNLLYLCCKFLDILKCYSYEQKNPIFIDFQPKH